MALIRVLGDDGKWRDLVGGFILAFGEIELFTHRLWAQHFPDAEVPEFFDARTNALLGVLRRDEDKNKNLIAQLIQARTLAHKRNTVAHNPTQVQVFRHTGTGKWIFRYGIASKRTGDYIDDAQLTELRAEAESIVRSLYLELGPPHVQAS